MAEKFDNPNYNPEAGMKYLATHFEMFKPEVAKAMIADAKRKGVKIPPVVEAKARKAGILNSVRNAKFVKGAKVVSQGGTRGEIVRVRTIYQHGFEDEVFDVLLESGPRKGKVAHSQREGEWNIANSVRSTNAVVAKALAMNGVAGKWSDPNAKMLKEKNGWQLWEGTHGYGMCRSNGHGGVWWGKVSRAAAIKHFDKFVADPIRTPLTINAVRNA